MNNVFDFKRFGQYFLYDLRRARNNYGLSLLILGTMPIIIFVFYELIDLIFVQEGGSMDDAFKFMAIFIAVIVAVMGAGTKIYGSLTEKKAGSDFLMLPASSLEKWLSMGIIVCIVIPLILFGLQIASDALMSFFFPNLYGDRVYALQPLQEAKDTLIENGIHIKLEAIVFLNWCANILVFTLGAICFKKSKVAKTLLCIFACSFLLSTLTFVFSGSNFSFYINLADRFDVPEKAIRALNWMMNISFTVIIGGLLGGLYYRIRTLKH